MVMVAALVVVAWWPRFMPNPATSAPTRPWWPEHHGGLTGGHVSWSLEPPDFYTPPPEWWHEPKDLGASGEGRQNRSR